MTDEDTNVTFSDADYEAIEAAVLETARGRWFLQQFAKRNRNADTEVVLATLSRLEQTILDDKAMLAMERIRANLQEMATAITQTKGEIGLSPRDSENGDLSDFLDAMGQETGPGSEEEFQALAEQRIRRTFQTLRYLEGRIHHMIAICDPPRESLDEGQPLAGRSHLGEEPAVHPGPHPNFLM
jgi:hypothetical protein